MTEQAQALASGGLEDLASFLDQPNEESTEENEEEIVGEPALEETTGEPTDDDSDDEGEAKEEDGKADEGVAPVDMKFKVPERHEDGTVTEIEVTATELIAGYERQANYTRKTQALATRENEAVQFLTQKHEEIRQKYLSQAELTRTAIVGMAGLKSDQDMVQLANTDPAAWVAENQRQRQIVNYLNQLDESIQGEKQQAAHQASQAEQSRKASLFASTWAALQKEGIDKPKLESIYGDMTKNYGYSQADLATVLDHRMVQVMRDAVAFRALKAQKADVTKKVQAAPRMPTRQASPENERRDRELNAKFKSGRAKLNDLAAYLQ